MGIRKGEQDSVAVAQPPTMMRPLVLPGSTAIIPGRLARIKPRFASARVVEMAQVQDRSPKTGQTEYPRAEAGRPRLEGRSPGGFLQRGRGIQEERSLAGPGATRAGPEDHGPRRGESHARSPRCFYLTQVRQCKGTAPRSTGPSTTSRRGRSPRTRSTRFVPRPRRSVPTRTTWFKTPEGRWVMRETGHGGQGTLAAKPDPGKESRRQA